MSFPTSPFDISCVTLISKSKNWACQTKKMINCHIKGLYKTTCYKTNSNSSQFYFSHWLLHKCFFESAKSRAWRACVLACLTCLRACVLGVLACSRAYVVGVLTCLRAHVLGVLACSRAYVLGVLTCLRAWRAYVLACSRAWRAYVLACLRGCACVCKCVLVCLICFAFQYLNLKILTAKNCVLC